jgi:hypothetical protein
MNRTQRELLVTTSAAKLYEVPLKDGTVWTGTRRELAATYPEWLGHAKEVRPAPDDTEDDDRIYNTRMPSSSRRYYLPDVAQGRANVEMRPGVVRTNIPPRRSAVRETDDVPQVRPRRQRSGLRFHILVYLGVGMLFMLALWVSIAWVTAKWASTQDDWKYTSTFRTFSIDEVVGHNNDSADHPSHFIVQNDKRKIVIVEFPADDPAKVMVYYGPALLGDGQDRLPITISFQMNPHTNRLDMVLHVQDQQYLFANNGTKFVAPQGQ